MPKLILSDAFGEATSIRSHAAVDKRERVSSAITLVAAPIRAPQTSDSDSEDDRVEASEAECATESGMAELVKIERQLKAKRILDSTASQLVMAILTLFALFAADLWQLSFDRQGDEVLTALLLVCFAFFLIEISATILINPSYVKNIFLWLDVVALLSLLLDCHFVTAAIFPSDEVSMLYVTSVVGSNSEAAGGSDGSEVSGAGAARTSRAAKIGTRAGRISKLLRVLRVVRLFRLVRMFRLREQLRQLGLSERVEAAMHPKEGRGSAVRRFSLGIRNSVAAMWRMAGVAPDDISDSVGEGAQKEEKQVALSSRCTSAQIRNTSHFRTNPTLPFVFRPSQVRQTHHREQETAGRGRAARARALDEDRGRHDAKGSAGHSWYVGDIAAFGVPRGARL